jgi:transcriptional regulator of acetoin/glycerol metabolism
MTPGDRVDAADATRLLGETPGDDGDAGTDETGGEGGLLRRQMDRAERDLLRAELAKAGWNVSRAARSLGIDRANLHRKMRRHGIERGSS